MAKEMLAADRVRYDGPQFAYRASRLTCENWRFGYWQRVLFTENGISRDTAKFQNVDVGENEAEKLLKERKQPLGQ